MCVPFWRNIESRRRGTVLSAAGARKGLGSQLSGVVCVGARKAYEAKDEGGKSWVKGGKAPCDAPGEAALSSCARQLGNLLKLPR